MEQHLWQKSHKQCSVPWPFNGNYMLSGEADRKNRKNELWQKYAKKPT